MVEMMQHIQSGFTATIAKYPSGQLPRNPNVVDTNQAHTDAIRLDEVSSSKASFNTACTSLTNST
jgi:hypothetical protein